MTISIFDEFPDLGYIHNVLKQNECDVFGYPTARIFVRANKSQAHEIDLMRTTIQMLEAGYAATYCDRNVYGSSLVLLREDRRLNICANCVHYRIKSNAYKHSESFNKILKTEFMSGSGGEETMRDQLPNDAVILSYEIIFKTTVHHYGDPNSWWASSWYVRYCSKAQSELYDEIFARKGDISVLFSGNWLDYFTEKEIEEWYQKLST